MVVSRVILTVVLARQHRKRVIRKVRYDTKQLIYSDRKELLADEMEFIQRHLSEYRAIPRVRVLSALTVFRGDCCDDRFRMYSRRLCATSANMCSASSCSSLRSLCA